MGVQRRNVNTSFTKSNFALFGFKKFKGYGSTFTFHHAHLKKAILLHKMARVPSDLNTAVCTYAVDVFTNKSTRCTLYRKNSVVFSDF